MKSFDKHSTLLRAKAKTKARSLGKFVRRSSGPTRVVAVCLASLLAFSAFNANIASIVDLFSVLEVKANPAGTEYFTADFDLYDYYNNNGDGRFFNAFNQLLFDDGYVTGGDSAKPWGNGEGETEYLLYNKTKAQTYYPLFLGLQYRESDSVYQYPYFKDAAGNEQGGSNRAIDAAYNYSLAANSQAGASIKGGAVQKLVDTHLKTDNGDGTYSGAITQGNGKVDLPYFSSTFLGKKPTNEYSSYKGNAVGTTQLGNKFRFRKYTSADQDYIGGNLFAGDDVYDEDYSGYYVYNSRRDGIKKETINGKTYYTCDRDGQRIKDTKGHHAFFPLEVQEGNTTDTAYASNYGYGAVFKIQFTMTKNGKTAAGQDMTFNFRGDDDVWVYIDGHLALDLGGAHGQVSGNINFAKARATAGYIYKESTLKYENRNARVEGNWKQNEISNLSDIFNQVNMYGDATKTHELTVFYIERGYVESNCLITFNFNPADKLTINNNVVVSEVNPYLQSATLLAARKEGIQYQLQNKGEATTEDSPDDRQPGADYNESLPFPTGGGGGSSASYSTLTYNMQDGSLIKSYDIQNGNTIVLASSIDDLPEGIELKGWTTDNTQAEPMSEYAPGKMMTMNGDLTLYARTKAVVTAPKVPTIVYANHTCGCAGLPGFMPGGNNSVNKMTNITGNYFGYLLTYDWTLPENSGYIQHKNFNGGSDSQYSFGVINAGDIVFVTLDNDANSNCSKTTYTYSSLSGLDSNVYNDWLKGYVKLYYALVDAKANLDADDTLDGTAYATAHSKYKNATFGTAASEFTSQITALQTAYGITPRTLNAALPPDLETEEFDSPDILANIFDPDDPDAADTAGATTDQPETTGDQPADDTQTTETTQATEPVQATETTQATEPEQPSEPEQTTEPDANAPASTGLTAGAEGHWAGSSDYANVGNTNYQLKYIAGGKSVLRKTMTGSNTFNLVADQSATFSNQFSRGSRFRIAQTGSSWYFDEPETDNTATQADKEGYYTGAEGNLSKRYKTGWRISDDAATPNNTASVYGYSVFNTVNPSSNCSLVDVSMNYLDESASGYDMVHLTVNFYNWVRVGDVKVSKDLTDEAKAVDGYEDKEFTFKVTFSEIFGDEKSDEFNFAGQSVVIYKTANPSNTRNVTIGADGTFKMKYGEYVMFEDIPVYTKYTIQETQPDGSDKGVVWTVNRVYTYHAYKDASNKQTFAGDIAVTANTTGTTEVDTTAKIKMNEFVRDTNPDSTDAGAVSTYNLTTDNMLSRYTGYKLDNDYLQITMENSLKKAILILTKTIDYPYYYSTIDGANTTDNPADLIGITTESDGVYSPAFDGHGSANDVNGYQNATGAEQTFIFTITEYTDSTFATPTGTVINETISFDGGNTLTKHRVIQVDPNKCYIVTEDDGWSWKYTLTSDNDVEVTSFNSTVTIEGNEYNNAAQVTFVNHKDEDNRNVEGDVSVVQNQITIEKGEDLPEL